MLEKAIDWVLKISDVASLVYSAFGVFLAPHVFDFSNPWVLTAWAFALAIASGFIGYRIRKRIVDAGVAKAEAVKRLEIEEVEKSKMAEIRGKFESLNLVTADIVSLAHGERNGLKLSADGEKAMIVRRREDVFVVSNHFANPMTIYLTPEWNRLMNEHGDELHKIWGPRKSEAYEPRRLME